MHFAEWMCTPSRVSFSPLFSNAGYQKKAIFLKLLVKGVISLFSYDCFMVWSMLLADFF